MPEVRQEECIEGSGVDEQRAGGLCYNEMKGMVLDDTRLGWCGVEGRRRREETRGSRRPRKAKISAHWGIGSGGVVNT